MGMATRGSFLSRGFNQTTAELSLFSECKYESEGVLSMDSLMAVGRCRTNVLDKINIPC